jgi:hypothetical protein
MNTDLRDKIAAALYLFTEEADQGTPGWDELIERFADSDGRCWSAGNS